MDYLVLNEFQDYSPVFREKDSVSVEYIREVVISVVEYGDDEEGLPLKIKESVVRLANEIHRLREEVERVKDMSAMMGAMEFGDPFHDQTRVFSTPETTEYVRKLLEESEK